MCVPKTKAPRGAGATPIGNLGNRSFAMAPFCRTRRRKRGNRPLPAGSFAPALQTLRSFVNRVTQRLAMRDAVGETLFRPQQQSKLIFQDQLDVNVRRPYSAENKLSTIIFGRVWTADMDIKLILENQLDVHVRRP